MAGSEIREISTEKGAVLVLPPSVLGGNIRKIHADDDSLLIIKGMTNDQIVELVRIWRGEKA